MRFIFLESSVFKRSVSPSRFICPILCMLSEGRRVHLSRTLVNTLNWHMLLSNDHELCNVILCIRHIVWTQHKLVCCHAYSSPSSILKRNRKLHLIIFFSPLSLSPPIFLYNSSLLPPFCWFHVSSKIFLPLTNFKYSLCVLSTIAYKHLEIIESQRADKKGSSDRAQWKLSNIALSQPSL